MSRATIGTLSALLGATALLTPAHAADYLRPSYAPGYGKTVVAPPSDKPFAFGVEVGRTTLEAHQTLHFAGHKNSELIWESDSVTTIGLTFEGKTYGGIETRIRGTMAVHADSYMEDYDWLSHFPEYSFPGNEWTHLSKHNATDLDHAINIDAQASKRILGNEHASLSLVSGVRYNDVKWTAHGGEFTYSVAADEDTGTPSVFRGSSFKLADDEVGVSYQQTYLSPYAGAGVAAAFGGLSARASGYVGIPVISSASDDHWQRALQFNGDMDDAYMTGFDASLEYTFADRFSLVGTLRHERYSEGSKELSVVEVIGPVYSEAHGNRLGGDHQQTNISLGAKYRF